MNKLYQKLDIATSDTYFETATASEVVVSTTNFNNNLSATDTDLQTALETLDDKVIPDALSDLTKDINFDERYYTETETDTLLAAKSDITHNHNLADLTEKSYNSLTDKPIITDELVKVDALDATAGYLADKVISTDDSLFVTNIGDKIDFRTAKSFTRHMFADVPMDYTFLNNYLAHPMQWLSVANDIKWLWVERGFDVFVNGEYYDRSQVIPNNWDGKSFLVRDNVFIEVLKDDNLSTCALVSAELRIRIDDGAATQYDYLLDHQAIYFSVDYGAGNTRVSIASALQGDITYILPDGWRSYIYINFYGSDGRFVGTIANGYHERIIEGIQ